MEVLKIVSEISCFCCYWKNMTFMIRYECHKVISETLAYCERKNICWWRFQYAMNVLKTYQRYPTFAVSENTWRILYAMNFLNNVLETLIYWNECCLYFVHYLYTLKYLFCDSQEYVFIFKIFFFFLFLFIFCFILFSFEQLFKYLFYFFFSLLLHCCNK